MRFNRFETTLSRILSRFPGLKQQAKIAYQRFAFMRNKKPYTVRTERTLQGFGVAGKESFWGYYDHSPANDAGTHVAYHSASHSTAQAPSSKNAVALTVQELATGEHIELGQTAAYNWQQGARLQWIGNDSAIFNSYDANTKAYFSKRVWLNGESKQYSRPIYDTAYPHAVTLRFERLAEYAPDYGYNAHTSSDKTQPGLNEDGVWYGNLEANNWQLIVALEQLAALVDNCPATATHYVNHLSLNAAGTHVMFLHRWLVNGVKTDRLFVCKIDGSGLSLLSDDAMVSHCCWENNDTIVGYLRHADLGDGYYRIPLSTGQRERLQPEAIQQLGDGHPGISGSMLITDTYPNKARMKELVLLNLETQEHEVVAELFESFDFYGATRCDLHPRFAPDGKRVFMDSVHEGARKLYCIEL